MKSTSKLLAAYKNLVWGVVNLANAPRGHTFQQQRDRLLLKAEQRQQFVAVAHQIVSGGLALGSLGELSLRISAKQLAITAQHSELAQLSAANLVICPLEPDSPAESAAPHLDWHRLIYRHTPAQAVLLGHPPYAVTLANAGQVPAQELMPEMWNMVGSVTLLTPAEFSLATLANAVPHHHGVLVPHIGVLIWGDSLVNVLARMQAVEYLSRLTVLANRTV